MWEYLAAYAAPKIYNYGKDLLGYGGSGSSLTPDQQAATDNAARLKNEQGAADKYSWTGYGGGREAGTMNQQALESYGDQDYRNMSALSNAQGSVADSGKTGAAIDAQQQEANDLLRFSRGQSSAYQSAAQQQYQSASNQSAQQAMALAASGRGNGSAAALQQAMAQGQQARGQAAGQSALMATQERQQAAQMAAQMNANAAGQRQQSAQLQGSLLAQSAQQRQQYEQMRQQQLQNEATLKLDAYTGAETRHNQRRMAKEANIASNWNAGIAAAGQMGAAALGSG